jgi:hypothetical protein
MLISFAFVAVRDGCRRVFPNSLGRWHDERVSAVFVSDCFENSSRGIRGICGNCHGMAPRPVIVRRTTSPDEPFFGDSRSGGVE